MKKVQLGIKKQANRIMVTDDWRKNVIRQEQLELEKLKKILSDEKERIDLQQMNRKIKEETKAQILESI